MAIEHASDLRWFVRATSKSTFRGLTDVYLMNYLCAPYLAPRMLVLLYTRLDKKEQQSDCRTVLIFIGQ